MSMSAVAGARLPVTGFRRCVRLMAGLLLAGFLAGCETVAETGRSQLILMPASADVDLGLQAYQQILAEGRVSRDPELNRRVEEVGRRIAAVSLRPDYDWEFTVFEDDQPNAFALPGGKVGVNSGLFKVAQNDDQLAAVLAHEVAHATARHGAERLSHGLLLQIGLTGLGVAADQPGVVELAAAAATLGVVLPFSRGQEAEADHIGLIYMAKAGYDPRQAIDLWQNFESFGGSRPPEFLSTHPSPGSRIQRLEALMPEAMALYEAGGGGQY